MKKYHFDKQSSCSGKVKHRSFYDAEHSIQTRRRKVNRDRSGSESFGGMIQIYKCNNPNPYTHWHIGKSAEGVYHRHAPYKRKSKYGEV